MKYTYGYKYGTHQTCKMYGTMIRYNMYIKKEKKKEKEEVAPNTTISKYIIQISIITFSCTSTKVILLLLNSFWYINKTKNITQAYKVTKMSDICMCPSPRSVFNLYMYYNTECKVKSVQYISKECPLVSDTCCVKCMSCVDTANLRSTHAI